MRVNFTKNIYDELTFLLIIALLKISYADAMIIRNPAELMRKHDATKEISVNAPDFYSYVSYLEDIIDLPILHEISPECMNVSLSLIKPILELTDKNEKVMVLLNSPLGKMLDSWGKLPSRILLANSQWKGASDECATIKTAKYCSTNNVSVLSQPGVSYGSCFPKECTELDVTKVLSYISGKTQGLISVNSDSSSTFCTESKPMTTGAYITLVIICILGGLCALGTIIDIFKCMKKQTEQEDENANRTEQEHKDILDAQVVNGIDNKAVEHESEANNNVDKKSTTDGTVVYKKEDNIPTKQLKPEEEAIDSQTIKLLTCFSLYCNSKAIFSTHVPDGSITSIHGIRVLSLAWVILGHLYVFVEFSSQPDNLLNMVSIIHRFTFMPISNAYVSVDTFFLLSGVLVGYLTLKRIDKQRMGLMDIPMYYFHRYVRLTPSLVLVILFYANLFPLIVKQPMGFSLSQINVQPEKCLRHWWQPLLYINNFSPRHFDDGCVPWTWYLANDMQFYIASPFILFMMVWIEKKFCKGSRAVLYNTSVIFFMCALSVLVTAVITQENNIPTLLTSALFLPGNPRHKQSDMVMDKLYVKPYTRATPYLIGLWLGYLFSRKMCLQEKSKKLMTLFGWMVAPATGLLVVYGTWNVYKENGTFLNYTENIVYSALHRFAWSCAVGWVIYACHNKVGGAVNSFLSWKIWIPLSRLTYGSYLVHIIVLVFYMFSRETASHYQDTTAVFDYIATLVVTFSCSFVLALIVEQPVLNLQKMIFRR